MERALAPVSLPFLMNTRFLICLAVCLGAQAPSLLSAQETNRPAFLRETVRSMDSLDNHQKLGPVEKITYRVIEDQDEPRTLLVNDTGDLEVPYLGLVHAGGKTCLELAQQIKGLLEKKLYYTATVMISAEVINKTRVIGKVY